MRTIGLLALAALLGSCRGEPVPRDYSNNPPAMTHPADKKAQTPTENGMPGATPEPATGVEGKTNGKPIDPTSTPPKLRDQAPVTSTGGSPATTATTSTTVTTTTR
jgi:hypothetical protein